MLIDLRTEGINIYFLCPFLGCFCLIGASFSSGQSIFGKYKFLENILVSVSQMLAIIPYLISVKIKNESFMNTEKSKEEKKQLINNNFEEENNIKISQGLCLGAVEFLKLFILNVGSDLFDIKFRIFFMSSNVLFLSFLQKCFLKTRIYRHQIASFIIFFVLDIAFIIIIAFDDLLEYNLMQLIFIFVSNLFFSFEITYEKTILNNKDISFEKLQELYILNLSDNLISEANDIKYFENLRELYMNNNKLEDINFCEYLPNLIILNFENNSIITITSLNICVKLKALKLANNQIKYLNSTLRIFKNLKNLEEITIKNNPFLSELNSYRDYFISNYKNILLTMRKSQKKKEKLQKNFIKKIILFIRI